MNFKTTAIAAVLAAASFAASAAVTPIDVSSGSVTFTGLASGDAFTFTAGAGDVLDLLSISSNYFIKGKTPLAGVLTTSLSQSSGFHITEVLLDGAAVGVNAPSIALLSAKTGNPFQYQSHGDYWVYTSAVLDAGLHTIEVKGAGTGSFTGNVAITAAVPEPETYALMLGGLGAIAFVARRRKSV